LGMPSLRLIDDLLDRNIAVLLIGGHGVDRETMLLTVPGYPNVSLSNNTTCKAEKQSAQAILRGFDRAMDGRLGDSWTCTRDDATVPQINYLRRNIMPSDKKSN